MKKVNRLHLLTAGILLMLFTLPGMVSTTQAQQLKIGYVDPQSILMKMPEVKAIQQKLQNYADRKRQELSDQQAQFQQALEQFQQKEAVISDQAKQQEQQKLADMNKQLQQKQSQVQQDIQQKQQELMQPIFNQIESAIQTVADDRGLTYVLNSATSNGDVIILYASDSAKQKYDITDSVMQELGI